MSRVTKYRAWDKEESRMIVHEQELIPLKVCSLGVLRLDPHYANNLWEIMPIDRFHIMQSSPLADKNEKEMYDGDFIKHNQNVFVVACRDNMGWCLLDITKFDGGKDLVYNKSNWRDWLWVYNTRKYLEVIGNIYETPNLLTRLASDAATI